MLRFLVLLAVLPLWPIAAPPLAFAVEPEKKETAAADPVLPHAPPDPLPDLKRLAKDFDIWVDLKQKLVVVGGEICLRQGPLEMFACPKGTKEHESIVSVNCPARFVHAALLAVGAKVGQPVKFDPKYEPAQGTVVDIWIVWKDKEGKTKQVKAQDFIKELKTGKTMTHSWVFAGSGFWTDETTGQRHYYGDGGELVCVSNFPSATLDLPIPSSDANVDLMFEAFTERIPDRGTLVRLVLRPRIGAQPSGKPADSRETGK